MGWSCVKMGDEKEKELETADTEHSKGKVRGRKKTMKKEIMVNSRTPDENNNKTQFVPILVSGQLLF